MATTLFAPPIPAKTAKTLIFRSPSSSASPLLFRSPALSLPTLSATPRSIVSLRAAATTAVNSNKATATGKSAPSLPFRVGHRFDLHRLEPGYPLIIDGISIPHDRGCEAHSDGMQSNKVLCFWLTTSEFKTLLSKSNPWFDAGDVLLHCVVDGILGKKIN